MAKKLILLFFILVIFGCSKPHVEEISTTTTTVKEFVDLSLIINNEGIFVNNTGNTAVESFAIQYKSFWFGNVQDKGIAKNFSFTKSYEIELHPVDFKLADNLSICVPKERIEKRKFNIYKCIITLYSHDKSTVFNNKTVFVSFNEGLNPWENEFHLVEERHYIEIGNYIREHWRELLNMTENNSTENN